MWVKSRIGSKPTFLFIASPSTCVGMPETISVRPSGSARATASVPTSPPPPAANGTTTRTALLGYSAASATPEDTATAAATMSARIMRGPLLCMRLIEDIQHALRLRQRHRRGDVFELERLFQRHIEPFHFGKLQRLFRKEFVARLLRQSARDFGDLGVMVDRAGIGIGPINRAAQGA